MRFTDRSQAGRRLAERLRDRRDPDIVVLALPRGGVPVAYEVARALAAPLDVLVVRKLSLPAAPELALGAIGEGGVRVLDERVVRATHATEDQIAKAQRRERGELRRRVALFRGGRAGFTLAGRTALIVDDGVATGSTARAACRVARELGAARVVLAVPVAARSALRALRAEADEVICLEAPPQFAAVGQFYDEFRQVGDDVVAELLRRAVHHLPVLAGARPDDPPLCDERVAPLAGAVHLAGHLTVPENPVGLVLFAHGSGDGRHGSHNVHVARALNARGLGTLLFGLLTAAEETDQTRVYDLGLLARRLIAVTAWLAARPESAGLRLGYFAASTGAAAALRAATDPRIEIGAIVARSGRPDLADSPLSFVASPTLLIVGGDDEPVLALNRHARAAMRCPTELAVVPGATHLFAEPGALAQVATLAGDWFTAHLAPAFNTGSSRAGSDTERSSWV